MRYLLDTHALLWHLEGAAALSPTAKALIEDPANSVWVSAASAWEIAIKIQVRKLALPVPFGVLFPDGLHTMDLSLLAIDVTHLHELLQLPPHHKDPFDRLLVAQALVEKMTLLSCDADIRRYAAPVIW